MSPYEATVLICGTLAKLVYESLDIFSGILFSSQFLQMFLEPTIITFLKLLEKNIRRILWKLLWCPSLQNLLRIPEKNSFKNIWNNLYYNIKGFLVEGFKEWWRLERGYLEKIWTNIDMQKEFLVKVIPEELLKKKEPLGEESKFWNPCKDSLVEL